ncbi:hypothetical protein VTJ83DRAFT_4847 [Remersonia thermophila]|uniref:Uncharacterized protein n=1 Tax=Remersonia thermophila TaxID=72144 RepID=A0ABR4DBW1_9PEZI
MEQLASAWAFHLDAEPGADTRRSEREGVVLLILLLLLLPPHLRDDGSMNMVESHPLHWLERDRRWMKRRIASPRTRGISSLKAQDLATVSSRPGQPRSPVPDQCNYR